MEILLPIPEKEKIIAEHGWAYFIQYQLSAIVVFYTIFNFIGNVIFLFKNYKPVKMGMLSLIVGFILEFAFMKPDWVQNIYAIKIGEAVVGAVIISALYWFIAWGIPSYIIHNYIFKGRSLSEKAQ
jgi:hypothetical protein